MTLADRRLILCADDFALSAGISDAIVALAEAGRLSATSVMVTTAHWPARAKSIADLRSRLAVGLHLNLTFERPLATMPGLAPAGDLPRPGELIARALRGALDLEEIGAQIDRQIDLFEDRSGFAPDFVDGHHHAHVLPGIRRVLVERLATRYGGRPLLIRDPADRPGAIVRRRTAAAKATKASALAWGMGKMLRSAGFLTNDGFSGFSTFGALPYAREFETFLVAPGARHMIMCHPGLPDSELGPRDEIAARRPEEYDVLAHRDGLATMLWRPTRSPGSAAFAFAQPVTTR